MLKLFPSRARNCERSRREFLVDVGSLSALGLTLPTLLRATAAASDAKGAGTGVNAILVWTRGGTSH
ncbi:MAG: DUF1501 domain-containing protein, partial [Planctomycetaceae bacterium]